MIDYNAKSTMFLSGNEFEELMNDPTQSFQDRVQQTLLGMKNRFTGAEYKRLYPSSSRPGLYFGLAKVHKLKNDTDSVEQLPLRPVISNIGTATYELSKYLATLPIANSNYTIDSTKDFVHKIRKQKIKDNYEMISFDVVSLFTSVPLDFTIDLILKKVYDEKLIATKLNREELEKLLQLCTKEMHFQYDGKIYRQVNGVAMGSPLGPVLANIFMVELEKSLVPTMQDEVALWFRYVDDTFTFVKKGCIDQVLMRLNGFHESIKFTFEKESGSTIAFLDVKASRTRDGSFITDIHRKRTDTNIYLNWKSFAPRPWKIGTLKGLIRRAFVICSTQQLQRKEVNFLKNVFIKINGYPSKVVNKVVYEVKRTMTSENPPSDIPPVPQQDDPRVSDLQEQESAEPVYNPFICLPYKGQEGEIIIKKFKNDLRAALPTNVKPRVVFKGTKLGSCFRIKDKVPTQHETNLIYRFKSPEEGGNPPQYIGQTKVRYGTRTYEHCNTDKKSAVYKYKRAKNLTISSENFEIIDKGFSRTVDRKLAEALYVKEQDPVLNRQKKTFPILLFN